MKYLFCSFLSILILLCFSGCGDYISKSEAEKIIIKQNYPHTDKDRVPYRFVEFDISDVPVSSIYGQAEKGSFKLTNEIKTVASGLIQHYNSVPSNNGCDRATAKVTMGQWGYYQSVPLIKEYFLGVQEAWTDKRKGEEGRAYAKYKTKFSINEHCYAIIKDSGGTLHPVTFMHETEIKQIVNTYNPISPSEFVSRIGNNRIITKEISFQKDSKGNWRR